MILASVRNSATAVYDYGTSIVANVCNRQAALTRSVEEWVDRNLPERVAALFKQIVQGAPVLALYLYVLPPMAVLVAPAIYYTTTQLLGHLPLESKLASFYAAFIKGSIFNSALHVGKEAVACYYKRSLIQASAVIVALFLKSFWAQQETLLRDRLQAQLPLPAGLPIALPAPSSGPSVPPSIP